MIRREHKEACLLVISTFYLNSGDIDMFTLSQFTKLYTYNLYMQDIKKVYLKKVMFSSQRIKKKTMPRKRTYDLSISTRPQNSQNLPPIFPDTYNFLMYFFIPIYLSH